MRDTIISYREMCDLEGKQTLQRGMNYQLNPQYSVILMSQRKNAPYEDSIWDDGVTIEYEGHDVPRSPNVSDPKSFDQPSKTKSGKPTQNGFFANAVTEYKKSKMNPELVRVYEKILDGVWSDKGFFKLIDFKYTPTKSRKVYRFVLTEAEIEVEANKIVETGLQPRSRIIPSQIKKEVWKRDGGKCVICKATDELHFDHDLPFSKGGTSILLENIRLLCARHNLEKSDKIE